MEKRDTPKAKKVLVTTLPMSRKLHLYGFIPVKYSHFFFYVPRSCHADQLTFHISLPKLKFSIHLSLFTMFLTVLIQWQYAGCLSHIGKVCIRAKWPIRPELIPVSVAWSDWEYFYSPLDGMLVHRRVTPSIKFAGTHLYTWVERGTVRVKCLCPQPGLEPRALAPESSALTMRPPRLPLSHMNSVK